MKLVGARLAATSGDVHRGDADPSPSERAIVDVLVDRSVRSCSRTAAPDPARTVSRITVGEGNPDAGRRRFDTLAAPHELEAERVRLRHRRPRARARQDCSPLVAEMDMVATPCAASDEGPVSQCPMDPTGREPRADRCPICGIAAAIEFVPAALELLETGSDGGHPADDDAHAGHSEGSIEWEDTMEEINRSTDRPTCDGTSTRETGKRNAGIDWAFTVGDASGDPSERDGLGPPDAPPLVHIHGAGRFPRALARGA